MTEDTRRRLELIEALLRQRREIEDRLEELLNPPSSPAAPRVRPVVPSIHTFIEEILRAHPEGLRTEEVFVEMSRLHPEMAVVRSDTTSSLVYLAHKRQTIERIAQGRYRIRST